MMRLGGLLLIGLGLIICSPVIFFIVVKEWAHLVMRGRGKEMDYFIKERKDDTSA